ncbi:hypothetical protein PO909_028925 [Leuciscus waleckii]
MQLFYSKDEDLYSLRLGMPRSVGCRSNTNLHTLAECSGLRLCQGDCTRWVGMDRFLGFVKQIRRSRRRKGKKYRPEEDYHEGYEEVYYYASEHLHQWTFMAILVYIAELLLFECYLLCLDGTLPFNRSG